MSHSQAEHSVNKTAEVEPLTCTECGNTLKSVGNLAKHMQRMHSEVEGTVAKTQAVVNEQCSLESERE